jgi:glycogen operon protein
MFNAYWEALDFDLPAASPGPVGWQRWIDTSLDSPEDITEDPATAPPVAGMHYRVAPRSAVALFLRTDDRTGPVIELKPEPG